MITTRGPPPLQGMIMITDSMGFFSRPLPLHTHTHNDGAGGHNILFLFTKKEEKTLL